MSLKDFNSAAEAKAKEMLLHCCHSESWATRMLVRRPFSSPEMLFAAARDIWFSLTEKDYLEAFLAHPKIGDVNSLRKKYAATLSMASNEQQGVNAADEKTLEELSDLNHKYEEKHGFIFIVFATGKSAQEMLEILKKRIKNSRAEEIKNAAEEQSKITRLRLEKIL